MKSKIIQYLKMDRTFEGGLRLYQEIGQSMSFKATLNRQGFTPYNHELLLEEFRKMAGISPEELRAFTTAPVELPKAPPVTEEEKKLFILEIPEQIRKTIRLRDEFPFLGQPGCPNELKILVADMISLHENYVKAHSRLFDTMTDEDYQETAASVVEDYLENQQIWEELQYYKENGKVLGNHVIFAYADRLKEIQAMPIAELHKLCNSLKSNISKTKKKIDANPEDPKSAEWTDKLENFQVEMTEVNRLLGLNA